MKRTQKTILGFLGLTVVAAMTVFAATIPVPGAQAVSTMTDTIRVTVIPPNIDVTIEEPPETGTVYTNPSQQVILTISDVKTLVLKLEVTNEKGLKTTYDLGTRTSDGSYERITLPLDLSMYGYGDYVFTATGYANEESDFDIAAFRYLPIDSETDEDPETGRIYTTLVYDETIVCSADINIYNGNKLIAPPSPIHVKAPTKRVEIPLEKLETGTYKVVATAYNCPAPGEDPQALPFPSETSFDYEKTPVPDTGSFFMGLNISKTDYLLTAIIVFFAFALLALGIVIKGRRNRR